MGFNDDCSYDLDNYYDDSTYYDNHYYLDFEDDDDELFNDNSDYVFEEYVKKDSSFYENYSDGEYFYGNRFGNIYENLENKQKGNSFYDRENYFSNFENIEDLLVDDYIGIEYFNGDFNVISNDDEWFYDEIKNFKIEIDLLLLLN